jgi:hypothetical protein
MKAINFATSETYDRLAATGATTKQIAAFIKQDIRTRLSMRRNSAKK